MRLRECMSPAAGDPHHIWSRRLSTIVLTALASSLVACSMGFGELEDSKDRQPRAKPTNLDTTKPIGKNLQTGITFLIDNQAEATGYGLYSYVLFESPPTPETKPIYLAVISACLKEIPDLGGLAKQFRPESLNALYIPITKDIAEPNAEEILQRYDYRRAQKVLQQLSKIEKNGGPYLASSLIPPSSSGRSLILFQDLSAVRSVSRQDDQTTKAYEWVLDFVDRVRNPRPTAWNPATLATFSDEIRDTRHPAFKRYVNVYDIVFPVPDNRTERVLPLTAWTTKVDSGDSHHINVREQ